ncbi:hypothetical protein RND81_12G152400 [Saponaria officinalis]|uniref:Bromo domain-containing protein n=1 Tax=Saponaria officinalis TaxID=3572 RepID=A0AAW1HAY8_SAPOF
MDVICRGRTTDPGLNKIRRLLKKRAAAPAAETKPKLNSSKNSSPPAMVPMDKITLNTDNKKRKSETCLEPPLIKRSKTDHCKGILTKLIKHKWSAPFRSPVDPDAAGDYFRVVKHPMDFGTIKQKLQQNKYIDDDEFEADVRRIFSNATLYHPSNNWVHLYATKLSRLFDILWLSVKPNLTTKEPPIIEQSSCDRSTTCNANLTKEPIIEQNNSGGSMCDAKEAARVAKLKARFADTILRAKIKMENQLDNRARIDAETKATTEVASQMKMEECRLKKQREQERKAARTSLEQMERSITLDDNLGAMRDLEALMRSGHDNASKSDKTKSHQLERLGLFIKPEYRLGYDEDDDLFLRGVDLEEGEILV